MPENFAESIDARDWAKAFVELVRDKPEIATDEGTMIGWFANALMRGLDVGRTRAAISRGGCVMLEEEMEREKQDVLRRIDKFTEPDKMSKQDAADWLDELVAEIGYRTDALYEEMEEEEEDEEEDA